MTMQPVSLLTRHNPFSGLSAWLHPGSERATVDREREAALADVRAFAGHAWILHPTDGPMKFVPWPWQPRLLAIFAVTRLLVVLKARQLGVSWLAAIYALWFAIRKPGQVVLLISQRQDDADKLLEKVAFVYNRLPAWRPLANVATRSIRFPGLGSEIESLPATDHIGRSRTASLVILDEHAHQPFARKIFLALKPVAEKGQILSISSGNGEGALHSKIYLDAKKGTNGFQAVFVPATAHPDRQAPEWHERNRAEMSALSDAEYAQEYPENDVEAIATTGNAIFDHRALADQPIEAGTLVEPGLTIYRDPAPGAFYVIGADPAEGLVDSDWSSASVVRIDLDDDTYRGEQVAVLRGRWAPEVFAAKLDKLARRYGRHVAPTNRFPVLLAWERNNHGHAVRVKIEELYTAAAPYGLYRARDKRLGWLSTPESRTLLVDQLAEAIRTRAIAFHDEGTLDQCRTFHENEKGRAEAQEGFHDDDVIAAGIAWQLRRRAFGRVLDVPARRAAA